MEGDEKACRKEKDGRAERVRDKDEEEEWAEARVQQIPYGLASLFSSAMGHMAGLDSPFSECMGLEYSRAWSMLTNTQGS